MRLVPLASLALLGACGCSTALDYDSLRFNDGDAAPGDGPVDVSVEGSAGSGGAKDGSPGQDAPKPTETGAPDGKVDGAIDGPADEPNPGLCNGVTCSGHGTCQAGSGSPQCTCDPGYHASGLNCEPDQTCTGKTCGRCATCEVVGGAAQCTCPTGMKPDGQEGCVVDPDPCDTTTCGADEMCIPEAHCGPFGGCVPTCDCSNCPNCGGDNSDGKWNDWQEYCGNPNQSPATMKCTKPCPNGEGCLPYATQICWPMEGCFSL